MARSKGDIEEVGPDDPRFQWPRTSQAQADYGIPRTMLENLVRRGEVSYVYSEGTKERLFDPESLALYSDKVTDKHIEADVTTTVLGLLKSTNKDLNASFKELLRLSTEPWGMLVKTLLEENQSLRAELQGERTRYASSIEAFEAALTESHEREMARLRAENREKRMNEALDKALDQLPTIVAGITGKRGLTSFFESLTEEQKLMLFEVLTDSQKAWVMKNIASHGSNGARAPVKGTEQPKGDNAS